MAMPSAEVRRPAQTRSGEFAVLQSISFPLAILTAVLAGLGTGSLFAFSSFVMGALARLAPAQAITAMQSINIVVINPLFMGAFMGAAACFVLLAATVWQDAGQDYALLVWIAAALYLAGMIGVTLVCNVPLNNGLAVVEASRADAGSIWAAYYRDWQFWNHIRTAAGALSLALLILAIARMPSTGAAA
jgi:uncharacterized membrane protein